VYFIAWRTSQTQTQGSARLGIKMRQIFKCKIFTPTFQNKAVLFLNFEVSQQKKATEMFASVWN